MEKKKSLEEMGINFQKFSQGALVFGLGSVLYTVLELTSSGNACRETFAVLDH